MQSFDHAALQGQVANKNQYISITRVSMATKLGKMITSLDGLLLIMSHDPLIRWPFEIRGSLTGGGSTGKHLSRHQLLVTFDIAIFNMNVFKRRNLQKTLTMLRSNLLTMSNILRKDLCKKSIL